MSLGERLASLGFDPLGFAFWLADALIVLALASALSARLAGRTGGATRILLALVTLALALVTLTALGLGFTGLLGPAGFLSVHLALLVVGAFLTGARTWRSGARRLAALSAQSVGDVARGIARVVGPAASRPERFLSLVVFGVLGSTAVLAALSPPLNGDTLGYRLPRIAWWLQEGRLGHIAAFDLGDARVNYVTFGADLVMLWVVGFFRHGFPLVELPQLVGGVLAGAATYRLTLELGLSRVAALASVVLLLGMPNVCAQLLTAQTDLYTSGCAAAFLVFMLISLRSGRRADWALAGAALGLAVGAKGTMFYWAPGLLLLLAAAAVLARTSLRAVLRGVLLAGLVALPLGGAAYALNLLHYGTPFSPPGAIGQVHVQPQSSRLHFAGVNGLAYAWQLLEPTSNPPFVRGPVTAAFEAGAKEIMRLGSVRPPFPGFASRFEAALQAMRDHPWHEDFLSMGVLAATLAAVGGLRALAGLRRRAPAPGDRLAVALLASVAAFLLVFCLFQAWTSHKYRYFVLVAPPLAALAVRALTAPGRRPRAGAKAFAVAAVGVQAFMAVLVPLASPENGLPSLRELPRRTRLEREEARRLLDVAGPTPLKLCLGPMEGNGPIGFFLRGRVPHHLSFTPAAWLREAGSVRGFLDTSGCDALVLEPALLEVPLGDATLRFAGTQRRRGIVRPLRSGRAPEAVCLHSWGLHPTGWTRRRAMVRFDNWPRATMPLHLENPTPLERTVTLSTSATEMTLSLAPGESRDRLELPVATSDRLSLHVAPLYHPPNAPERGLGVYLVLPPSLVCREASGP